MPKVDILEYRLAPQAEADLSDIWFYSAQTWGIDRADQYIDVLVGVLELLVVMPEMGREHFDIDPPARVHPSSEHLVVYVIEADHVSILRVLAARQNWQVLLGEG